MTLEDETLRAAAGGAAMQTGNQSSGAAARGLGYYSSDDMVGRFRCSKRTLARWMARAENPLPLPAINHWGAQNLWEIEAIAAWEEREKERTRRSRLAKQDAT